ncbi:MAG: hypothetical protein JXR73_14270 [Candidatus Omnitrophica bacterium]|nr:hypothetical protein [Candidatus Omnitrophota bacterium]
MKSFRFSCILLNLLLILSVVSFSLPVVSESADLSVGYAELDITPPLGVTMPGYFHTRHASEILDPLLVKALILRQRETTLVFAAFDLIGIPASVAQSIREEIEKQTGVPSDHVFVHGTHTHTGATVSEIKDKLPEQAAAAVQKALENCVAENQVSLGVGQEKSVAFIRRYLMTDGTVRTNPGRSNPNIVRPIGQIDPSVNVITFGAARTLLVSYGLHLDCIGGDKFSADYPYHLTQAVKQSLGDEWNVIYLNACCGNVNHINVNDPGQRSGYDESRRIGQALAQAVLAARKTAKPIQIDSLDAQTEIVSSPIRAVPPDMLEWAQQQMKDNPDEANKRKFNEQTPFKILELAEKEGTSLPAEIIAFRIGPLAVVGLPAEVFKEVAGDIKRHSLLDPTLVIGVTGGYMGYLPHPRGYDEGGYEATFGSARFAPQTSILWADAAVRLIQKEIQNKMD